MSSFAWTTAELKFKGNTSLLVVAMGKAMNSPRASSAIKLEPLATSRQMRTRPRRFALLAQAWIGFCGLVCLVFWGLGCQQVPTRVQENRENPFTPMSPGDLVIDANTSVVDARSSFDFTLVRIPGSFNVRWEEFFEKGQFKKNQKELASRLARNGVHPDRKIIVVGKGLEGDGEEARVAWALVYLGCKNVFVADVNQYKKLLTNVETGVKGGAKSWSPQYQDQLIQDPRRVKEVFKNPTPQERLLDVRSEAEYFKKSADSYTTPNLATVNVPWKDFIDGRGGPKASIKKKLEGIHITPAHEIILLSSDGRHAATAAYYLGTLGFSHVRVVMGGYEAATKFVPDRNYFKGGP